VSATPALGSCRGLTWDSPGRPLRGTAQPTYTKPEASIGKWSPGTQNPTMPGGRWGAISWSTHTGNRHRCAMWLLWYTKLMTTVGFAHQLLTACHLCRAAEIIRESHSTTLYIPRARRKSLSARSKSHACPVSVAPWNCSNISQLSHTGPSPSSLALTSLLIPLPAGRARQANASPRPQETLDERNPAPASTRTRPTQQS